MSFYNYSYLIDISNRKLNDNRPFLQKFFIKNLLNNHDLLSSVKIEKFNLTINNTNIKNNSNTHDESDDNIPLFYLQQKFISSYKPTNQIPFQHIDKSQFRQVILRGLNTHQNYLLF